MTASARAGGRLLRVAAAVVTTVAVAGLVLLPASPAGAHAALVAAAPDDGATLTSAPSRVVLRFDENVRTSSVLVVDGPSGRVSHGPTRVVDDTVGVAVTLAPRPSYVGQYTVGYRVVSSDGHPVAGRTTFRYAPPGVKAAPGTEEPTGQGAPGGSTGWVVGGVVVVLLGAGGLLLAARRRGSS